MHAGDITIARYKELIADVDRCQTVSEVKSLIAGGFGDDDIIEYEIADDIYDTLYGFARAGLDNIHALFVHAISRVEELS